MSDDDVHSAFLGSIHTEYKHEILRKYLRPWMQILRFTSPTIAYVDCYAGPGLYSDGTEGSPLIALQIANKISIEYGCTVWCIFNDRNEQTLKQLKKSLQEHPESSQVLIFPSHDDARDCVNRILNDERFATDGRLSVPMFFFIDPFGLNVPMEMLKKIMNQPKTEILVTFMAKDIVRWSRTIAYEQTMMQLFDHPDPLSLIRQTEGRHYEQRAVNAFVSRLKDYANVEYVITFRVCSDDERRTLFYMVHGSNHFKGFKLMKDIMYWIGIPGTFAYLGPSHPDECQTQLDTRDSDVEYLMNRLVRKHAGETSTYHWIMEESYVETAYIEKPIKEALKRLEAEGKVRVTGPRGNRGGFKPNTVFEFIEGQ